MDIFSSLTFLIPEVILIISTLLGLFLYNKAPYLPLLGCGLALLYCIYPLNISDTSIIFNGFAHINPMLSISRILLLALSTLFFVIFLSHKSDSIEKPALILFSIIGSLFLLSANDFISLYIAIEIQAVPAYVLTAMNEDKKSSEASLKYFILGALSSGVMLFGISILYALIGSTGFEIIALHNSTGMIFGAVFIVAGLMFKIAVAPFHIWLPDIYEGASTIVATFFSTIPKFAASVVIINFFISTLKIDDLHMLFSVLITLSVWISAFGAMQQTNIKRLLAYSSIGHMGYALCGILSQQISISLLYVFMYSTMTMGVFALILCCNDWTGLYKAHPYLSYSAAILLFSMSGIPPMAGFITKYNILLSLVQSQYIWLTIVLLLSSVLSAYYYLKLVRNIFFIAPSSERSSTYICPKPLATVIHLLALFNLLFFTAHSQAYSFLSLTIS